MSLPTRQQVIEYATRIVKQLFDDKVEKFITIRWVEGFYVFRQKVTNDTVVYTYAEDDHFPVIREIKVNYLPFKDVITIDHNTIKVIENVRTLDRELRVNPVSTYTIYRGEKFEDSINFLALFHPKRFSNTKAVLVDVKTLKTMFSLSKEKAMDILFSNDISTVICDIVDIKVITPTFLWDSTPFLGKNMAYFMFCDD